MNATLDSIKFDNYIDLDREKTREQLGFNDVAAQLKSAADIFKVAKETAAKLNAKTDQQRQVPQKDHTKERGE